MNHSERYSRQTMLAEIGEEGQRKIAAASVLIIGLGGLGAPVATYPTGAGVGHRGLCDPDTVSESNLQRQVLYDASQLGRPKTECAAARLQAASPHTVFTLHDQGLTPANARQLIASCDLVVDCCDNFATRYLIDDTCSALGKTWVYGAIVEFQGQVAVMNGTSRRRYSDLYPERDALCGRPRKIRGVLGPVPGLIGSLQAMETLKLLTGAGQPLDGKLFTIDLLSLSTNIIEF